jgi:hypothetical protein
MNRLAAKLTRRKNLAIRRKPPDHRNRDQRDDTFMRWPVSVARTPIVPAGEVPLTRILDKGPLARRDGTRGRRTMAPM